MVIFSHELFSIQSYGGVTRCMIDLMRALGRQPCDWLVWAGRHGSEPLEAFRDEPGIAPHVTAGPVGPLPGRLQTSIVNEWRFRGFVGERGGAIVHRSQYPAYDMIPRTVAKVSTLHDMWTERADATAGERVRSGFKRRALERSDAIVCVSEHSRQAMIDRWPHLAARAVTIHHGARAVSTTPVPAGEQAPYFLFVGAREARKNFAVLIAALAIAPRLAPFVLVCVGGGAFDEAEQRRIEAAGLRDRVRQRPAGDDALAGLYEGATALVYPSTFEGFGMPLLEAMVHRCPAITTPLSCLPEIGGDAAIYADAHDPEAWRAAMERIAFDTAAAADARARGSARAARFTWAAAAARHGEVYAALR